MSCLRLNPMVIVSLSQQHCLAYRIDTNQLHRLNATAALLTELCDGRTREEILAVISPLTDEGGRSACAAWLEQALSEGLIIQEPTVTAQTPLSAGQLCQLADDLRSNDRVLAAFICQQRAAELAPADPQQWYRLGELAHIVGRREEARQAYERYQAAHPEDVEVAHILLALRDQTPPARAPEKYIQQLYSRFAPFYDQNMCGELDYRAPDLLCDAIISVTGSRTDLNVLDLGCGTGLFGQKIRARARSLSGVDLSSDMLEGARQRNLYDRLEAGEITRWLERPSDERFDVIAFCDTLIYFGDLRQVLNLAAERLAPAGMIAFTVEVGQTDPYGLTDSGRFAHHRNHLTTVAASNHLSTVSLSAQTLRYEYGQPVAGWVALLQR